MSVILTNALAALLLPPLNLLLVGGAGWLLLKRRRPLLGKTLIFSAIALLWLLSTPIVADKLIASLEASIQPAPTDCSPQAIVVLGAGTYTGAPEYGGDTVPLLGLERLRFAAYLHRRTLLPILVTGGRQDNAKFSEAALMKDVLEKEFKVPVKWIEDTSHNTRENAMLSQQILQRAGIDTTYLVTQAWHMPRAQRSFAKVGLCVVPAGTGFKTPPTDDLNLLSFLPSAVELYYSHLVMHEAIGMIWYRLRS